MRHRLAVGVTALATVVAVGAGATTGSGQAGAATVDDIISGVVLDVLGGSSGLGQLGTLADGLMDVVNGGGAGVADQWRVQLCGSGAANGGADCSRSTGVGLAMVAPGRIELVPVDAWGAASGIYDAVDTVDNLLPAAWQSIPDLRHPELPEGEATIGGSGFQFAFASTGGEATAISYLPVSLATAGASDGREAYAFAVVGMANAWTTDDVTTSLVGIPLPITLPGIGHVSCFGGLTAAYADGVGACVNVVGTFDFRWTAPNGELQFGLTDPTGILFDPASVLGTVIAAVMTDVSGAGNLPITLGKDFARLGFGGDHGLLSGNFVRLTSDYGSQGETTIEWLGQKLTLNPMVDVNGQDRPNHLGVPSLDLSELDPDEIVPVVSLPEFASPFGLPDAAGPSVTRTPSAAAGSEVTGPGVTGPGDPGSEVARTDDAGSEVAVDGTSVTSPSGEATDSDPTSGGGESSNSADGSSTADDSSTDSSSPQSDSASAGSEDAS
ncbi:hypothetical protein GTV32_21050 [Gordonia sp. SID5947]|uniref:hypothetical protein n=1 Tax=Gordonia sp. SID5947 TaxID=2690315 RepID=UPI0013714A86|nr:hypothetical protein [Gordonia sp. SID5947]MYR08640.1 hypothetical protein [Gordonia sp. SID5947]